MIRERLTRTSFYLNNPTLSTVFLGISNRLICCKKSNPTFSILKMEERRDILDMVYSMVLETAVTAEMKSRKTTGATAAGGAAIFAGIGSLILPGIGTVIGIAVGGLLGILVVAGPNYSALVAYLEEISLPERDALSQRIISNISVLNECLIRRIVTSGLIFELL